MRIAHKRVCEELLWDLICYEMHRGTLSPEMKYLLDIHLAECPMCRHRIRGFKRMLQGSAAKEPADRPLLLAGEYGRIGPSRQGISIQHSKSQRLRLCHKKSDRKPPGGSCRNCRRLWESNYN
jgi:hypothetical protein